ncbi:MAG: hypothetical protein K0Q55_1211 [Verrucomicrobia bacterium]|jgi:hypothetical protein|nr:hypothetical protein [Verrucomicrobiota bacterium]
MTEAYLKIHRRPQIAGVRLLPLFLLMACLALSWASSLWAATNPEGPCVEKGPYYGMWTANYCPSQTNTASISPTALCGEVGKAPTVPTVVPPIYQEGQKQRTVTYDCPTTNAPVEYGGISYTVGSVQWDPPLPSALTNTFTSTAYVTVTSGDTNCPSPGRVDIGSATWTVSCNISGYTTNCTEGVVVLTNATVNPTNGCIGSGFSASASQSVSNAIKIITSNYTNACGNVDTNNCPPTYVTNSVAPTIVSNWWTVSVGGYSASGSGLSASFTPTNSGEGTITFFTKYKKVCEEGEAEVSVPATFKVVKVASLTPDKGDEVDDGDGNADTKMYVICAVTNGVCTVTAVSDPALAEADLPSCWSLTGGTGTGKLVRTVSLTAAGDTVITATAGTSSKAVTIRVRGTGAAAPTTVGPPLNYLPVGVAAAPAGWGVTVIGDPVFDITAYCNSPHWSCRITQADSQINQACRLLPGVVEVTAALVAAETNCTTLTTMATSLDTVASQGAHSGYYMLAAVQAHEDLHITQYKAAIAPAYVALIAAVEALNVPLKDYADAAAAAAAIKAKPAYIAAMATFHAADVAANNATAAHMPVGPFNTAEHGVVDPMIATINARKAALKCP